MSTPIGVLTRAETSATERRSQTPMIRPWRSSPQARRVAEVSSRSVASSGRSTTGRVRPAVSAYGRTMRAAGGLACVRSISGSSPAMGSVTPRGTRAWAWTI